MTSVFTFVVLVQTNGTEQAQRKKVTRLGVSPSVDAIFAIYVLLSPPFECISVGDRDLFLDPLLGFALA
ncbi:hypothetical protein OH492_22575 [Vibrio chagasii]|nr:hypothetical protein [Vibrio chagasii]